jgi:AcrR family transcriptional regulator
MSAAGAESIPLLPQLKAAAPPHAGEGAPPDGEGAPPAGEGTPPPEPPPSTRPKPTGRPSQPGPTAIFGSVRGSPEGPGERVSARERILETAYDLFSRHGVRAVGVDRIIATSGVAKMSLYRHFRSKDDLVLAFLERREERWTKDWLQAEASRRGETGAERLLAIFDVFDEWFQEPDFEGCSFINVLLEFDDPEHPVRRASTEHLATIRDYLREFAAEAGVRDPDGLAREWHILMKGSIVSAGEGDRQAARRARQIGELLLEREGALAGHDAHAGDGRVDGAGPG